MNQCKGTGLLVFFTLLAGCALVGGDRSDSSKASLMQHNEPVSSPSVEAKIDRAMGAKVQLLIQDRNNVVSYVTERDLSLDTTNALQFEATTTIVVPHIIPNEVQLSITLPAVDMSNVSTVKASGDIVGVQGSTVDFDVDNIEVIKEASSEEPKVHFRVSRFNQMFKTSVDRQAFLNVKFYNQTETEVITSVKVPVISPPSGLGYEQMTLAEYERTNPAIDPFNKTYRSFGRTLTLLQVIKLKNPLQYSVIAGFPLQPRGTLSTQVTSVQLNQQACSYTVNRRTVDETLANEVLFIPITVPMQREVLNFINVNLNIGRFEVELQPDAEVLIGIYAEGDGAASLLSRGRPAGLNQVQAFSSCRSRCGDPRRDMRHWDSLRRAEQYWTSQGWPGESRTCNDLRNTWNIIPNAAHPNEDAMNRCAQWELSNGTTPWDDRRFCNSPTPGNPWRYPNREFWNVEKTAVNVSVGNQYGTYRLNLDPGSTEVTLKYAITGKNGEASEARPLRNLIQTNTVQLQ
jgi:hypothetical protein